MDIGGYRFQRVGEIMPLREIDGLVRAFSPQDRYENRGHLRLSKYGSGPFCKFTIPNAYQTKGVYALIVNEQARYVGECENLSKRFNAGYGNISPRNCFHPKGQPTNCRINNEIYKTTSAGDHVSLWFFQTANYETVEFALRAALNLVWNLR
jgi:hypothetical protein